jgi:uncharacterized membrane protein
MKERVIKLALIVSVAFNIAAIAGIVYGVFFATPASSDKSESPYRVMNLTPEQREVVRREYAETMRRISDMHDQRTAKWVEAVELLGVPNPDWKAINAKQQEIQSIHREVDSLILSKWNELKEFVTPEQAEIFIKVLKGEIQSGRVFGKIKTETSSESGR